MIVRRSIATRGVLVDVLIAAAIFAASAWWGARYWSASLAAGVEPIFYQEQFEPAVMLACGRGFGVTFVPPAPLTQFLNRQTDRFSCSELPPTLSLTTNGVRQKTMRYLIVAVAATWRLTGAISWSGLGPLCGVLFGATTMLGYAVFRLGMARWVAAAATMALAVSTLHLQNAPHLRDYAKAPFALAAIWLIGCLVKIRPSWRVTPALAAAAGAVLGIGYGFRYDLLIYVPLCLATLVLFLDGGLRAHLAIKAVAAALLVGVFTAASWPIVSAISTEGGCEWHVVVLGFSEPFDEDLRIEEAPYRVSYAYLDGFAYHAISAYVARRDPKAELVLCSRPYDAASREYFTEIVTRVPADVLARAYASVRNMWTLPFEYSGPPLASWAPLVYRVRAHVMEPLRRIAPFVVLVTLVGMAAINLRWAAAATVVLLYTGGYPALQSHPRHYFHLEFMGWWMVGWIISAGATLMLSSLRSGLRRAIHAVMPDPRAAARRVVTFAAAVVVLLATPLLVARWYQQREMRDLFTRYIDAPKVPLAMAEADAAGVRHVDVRAAPDPPAQAKARSALLEFDFDPAACDPQAPVSFRYAGREAGTDFSWTLAPRLAGAGVTRVFFPAYEGFEGVQIVNARPQCINTAVQVADVRRFSFLAVAVLAPGWQDRPLYQRVRLP